MLKVGLTLMVISFSGMAFAVDAPGGREAGYSPPMEGMAGMQGMAADMIKEAKKSKEVKESRLTRKNTVAKKAATDSKKAKDFKANSGAPVKDMK